MLVRLCRFAEMEAAGGIVLFAAAVLALVLANSLLGPVYETLLDLPMAVQIGALKIAKPLLLWVNDGLMAIFFMVVGLEVKREISPVVFPLCAARQRPRSRRSAASPCRQSSISSPPGAMLLSSAAGQSRPPPISPSHSVCSRCSAHACRGRCT